MTLKEFYKIREKEGDKLEYNYKGYDISINRNPHLLFLCAYITIPKENKFYHENAHYDDFHDNLPLPGQEWTFGQYNKDGDYVLGFDCGHYGQYCPSNEKLCEEFGLGINKNSSDVYWTIDMCKAQLEELVDNYLI